MDRSETRKPMKAIEAGRAERPRRLVLVPFTWDPAPPRIFNGSAFFRGCCLIGG